MVFIGHQHEGGLNMSGEANVATWFEIPVSDVARATTFYESVLGVSLSPLEQGGFKMAWFPQVERGAGSSGALVQGEGRTPGRAGTLVYLNVADMDAALARVESSGGRVLLPKASGEFGSIAHFEDCEGNLVALHSR
jgi:predicted enzyme related to lactoylglutathione lyase